MSDDDDMFEWWQRTRAGDPWTSGAAAKRILRSITEKHRAVQEVHRRHVKGLTDWALEDILKDHGATYRTRRQELSNPQWFNPPYILNSGQTRREPRSRHPVNERIIWVWYEYYDPALAKPMPELPLVLPPTNAHLDEAGRLIKVCAVCGDEASFGFGVSMLRGRLGTWYCAQHRPVATT